MFESLETRRMFAVSTLVRPIAIAEEMSVDVRPAIATQKVASVSSVPTGIKIAPGLQDLSVSRTPFSGDAIK